MPETYLPIVALGGLGLLAILCLPIAPLQKLVLVLSAWVLRLVALALLAGGAYLWFHPEDLPPSVADAANSLLSAVPRLRDVVPEPGTPPFGACAAASVVVVLLPLLALLDVGRRLAGWRLARLRALAAAPPLVAGPAPVVYRVNRRTAAEALADAGRPPPAR
jgi:hypothetical protein